MNLKYFVVFIYCLFCLSNLSNAVSPSNQTYIYINKTDCLLFYTRQINVHFNKSVLVLDAKPNEEVECNNKTVKLMLKFELKSKSQVEIVFNFAKTPGRWLIRRLSIDVVCQESNCTNVKNLSIATGGLSIPQGVSYHCLTPVMKSVNHSAVRISFNKIQIEPFAKNAKFGSASDCVGFFSEGSLAVIFVSILLLAILTLGLYMMMGIQTSDRFDNPKGKIISIGGTE